MEYMDQGNISNLIKRCKCEGLPTQFVSCIVSQVALGLKHLHDRKLVYRDLEPEHILHNMKGEVKLTMYLTGPMCAQLRSLDTTLPYLTESCNVYMSPERCLGEEYSFPSDIWSLGMVTYELATGEYAFGKVLSFVELFQHLVEKPEPRIDSASYPHALCDLVSQCLVRKLGDCYADGEKKPAQASDSNCICQAQCISVNNLAGESIFGPLEIRQIMSVRELKLLVLRETRVKRMRLQLVLGGRVLEDDAPIGTENMGSSCLLLGFFEALHDVRMDIDDVLCHEFVYDAGSQADFSTWLCAS